ncbi:MAG: hypothetical protein H7144_06870 [Burkholderiales bacterium]|nr:hypothetical protein [Phycisphaerae bacterium]
MSNEIYVDPSVATADSISIRVGGLCYVRVGPSTMPPNIFEEDIKGRFDSCRSCTLPTCFFCKAVELWSVAPFAPSVIQLDNAGARGTKWSDDVAGPIPFLAQYASLSLTYPLLSTSSDFAWDYYNFGGRAYFGWEVDESGFRNSPIVEAEEAASRLKIWWRYKVGVSKNCAYFGLFGSGFCGFHSRGNSLETPYGIENSPAAPTFFSPGPIWFSGSNTPWTSGSGPSLDSGASGKGNFWGAEGGTPNSIETISHNYFSGMGYYDPYPSGPWVPAYVEHDTTLGATTTKCRDGDDCVDGEADDQGDCL